MVRYLHAINEIRRQIDAQRLEKPRGRGRSGSDHGARSSLGLVRLRVRRTLSYLASDGETARFFSTGRGIVFAGMSGLFKF